MPAGVSTSASPRLTCSLPWSRKRSRSAPWSGLLSFEQGKASLLEITLADDAAIIGKEIAGAGFPRDSTVVAILRRDHVVVPRGDTMFSEGDEVLVLVTPESEPDVRSLLTASR